MTFPDVSGQNYPTEDEVLAAMLNSIRYGYSSIGINVNVKPGTEIHYRAKAVASRVAILVQNNKVSLANVSPLDAVGDELEELAGVFGVEKRPATAASGNVIVKRAPGPAFTTFTIPQGFVCTSAQGISYETTSASTVSAGDSIQVQAVTLGANTEVPQDTVLTWDSASIGQLLQTTIVAPGGLDGGADADGDEELRKRLLRRLGLPAVGGNSSHVIQLAEGASAAVQKAFVYPSVRGPATYNVALISEGGDRAPSSTIVTDVSNIIVSELPAHADGLITSVVPEYVDVIVNVAVPAPIFAGGAGGGWRDADHFANSADAFYAEITAVSPSPTTNGITIDTSVSPKAGQRIGIWNPAGGTDGDGEMHEFTITGLIPGTPPSFLIVIDGTDSTDFIAPGMYISAGAEDLKAYSASILAGIQLLGAGELTASPDILPRGARVPRVDDEFPYSVTTRVIKDLLVDNPEIDDITFVGRWATGTKTTLTSPTIPPTTSQAPNILVLKNLAIRRLL